MVNFVFAIFFEIRHKFGLFTRHLTIFWPELTVKMEKIWTHWASIFWEIWKFSFFLNKTNIIHQNDAKMIKILGDFLQNVLKLSKFNSDFAQMFTILFFNQFWPIWIPVHLNGHGTRRGYSSFHAPQTKHTCIANCKPANLQF